MKLRPKQQFILLCIATLVGFSGIGVGLLYWFADIPPLTIFELGGIFSPLTLVGLEFGLFYSALIIFFSQAPLFKKLDNQQGFIIHSMQLSWPEMIFASFCAGFGEEILFRAAIQTWLGPIFTSLLFVAIHGYIHPLSWRKSILGFLLLPFVLILAYGYEAFGLWFCIAAHFTYDLLAFVVAKYRPY